MTEHEFMLALLIYSHMSFAIKLNQIVEYDERVLLLISSHFTYATILKSIFLPEFI